MEAEVLRQLETVREFFKIEQEGELAEGTRLLLEAMTEVVFSDGQDIVRYGAECDDGMYIILEGTALVYEEKGSLINTLGTGDFIGELGLINDDRRAATVRAKNTVRCANISKALFESMAAANQKLYGTFMNMLYVKTTKLVTEQERIRSELSIATQIQMSCLEDDFTEFNRLPYIGITARMRPAKEVGGDFYDVFSIDEKRLCFLIADVSGKGVPAAIFMSMAKTHIRNYATLGLPLEEIAYRVNNQLCYKNDAGMFVTAFICVLDLESDEVSFINAGHNRPFVRKSDGIFYMIEAKADLVLGMMEERPYREQHISLEKGDCIYLYTDGVTEALNKNQELLGNDRLLEMLNGNTDLVGKPEEFVDAMYNEIDAFAEGEMQADDITMVYLSRCSN